MIVERQTQMKARQMLRACLEAGKVRYGPHFTNALADEKVDLTDAWGVLREGQIYDPPEEDMRTGKWKYRIEDHEPGGKWLAIIFCFEQADQAFLITVFSVKAKSK